MSTTTAPDLSFAELDLPAFLLETLEKVGYEKPSPIQQATIPALLQGRDIVGMAQTGTGKTAAFALPVLAHIDVSNPATQALVLCPTRELAIQVAEAFQTYAQGIRGFHVLPVYGGQDMGRQLQALRRGAHVVVGTPGRLLDHLNRRTLDLSTLKTLVLDEADEMLRMGFIDDVELILQKTPKSRQVALFSATMPAQIRNVAEKYLNNPQEVKIKTATSTNADIEQFYWLVQGTNKLDALTRMLEVEDFDGMIVFVRTKNSTVELADKLSARGFSASALNGDMNQQLRSRTVEQLKNGQLDIVVATDVAARGLDVERITHVMNYDIPYDNEAYVHRIGRTGRAGRSGKAILFVAPREQRMLQSIERTTRMKIERMDLPTRADLIMKRSQQFKDEVITALANDKLDFFHSLIADLCQEQGRSAEDVAAAMAWLLQKDRPLEPAMKGSDATESGYGKAGAEKRAPAGKTSPGRDRPARANVRTERSEGSDSAEVIEHAPPRKTRSMPPVGGDEAFAAERPVRKRRDERVIDDGDEVGMDRFRIQVGHEHGVTPREIVGAIANEGGIEGRYIGRIQIYDNYSTIDLPEGMPDDILQTLQRTRVCNQSLDMQRMSAAEAAAERAATPSRPRRPAGSRPDAGRSDAPRSEAPRFDRKQSSGADRPQRDDRAQRDDSPKRATRRERTAGEAKVLGPRKPRKFAADGGAAAVKEKKRSGAKKRLDKDKGKRRNPSKKV